jgi:hypothetical protein
MCCDDRQDGSCRECIFSLAVVSRTHIYSRAQHFVDNPPRAFLRSAVYSGYLRPQDGFGPTARWFVVRVVT